MATAVSLLAFGVLAVGGLVGIGVGYVAWRHRGHPAATPLAKMAGIPGVTGLCYAALVFVRDPGVAQWLLALANATLFIAPGYFLLFTIAYTGRSQWITPWRQRAVVGVFLVSATVGALEPVALSAVTVQTTNGLTLSVVTDRSVTKLATLVFSYPAILVGLALLSTFLVSPRNVYRKQTAVITFAVLFTVVGNIVFEVGLSPHPGLNLTAVFFAAETAIIAVSLFRYEFLNVEPLAPDVVLEEIEDPVLVLDDEKRLVDANPAAMRLFDAAATVGEPVESVAPGLLTAIESDDEYVPTGDGSTGSGTVEVYDLNRAPIRDQYDRDRGNVIVLRDITLQKHRQRTFESLQSVSQRFLTADTTEEVLDIAVKTAEEVLGYPYSGAMLYDPDENVLRPATFAQPLQAAYADHDSGGDPTVEPNEESDVWRTFESGESMLGDPIEAGEDVEIPVDLGGSLLYPLGEHGVLGISAGSDHEGFSEDDRRFVAILASSTENALDRIARERELRSSRELLAKRKEQIEFFNSVLRHDLLNSLQVVEGHTDWLQHELDGEPREHVDTIDDFVRDITSLAQKVRAVTKTVSGERRVEPESVSLADAVRRKAEKIEAGHDSVTVTVVTDLDVLPEVQADDLLPEVIENLLVNAIEHNDTGAPEIIIDAVETEDAVQLRIADNGPGIDDDMKETVFDEQVTADSSGSVGFGLYFVSVMVDLYGGAVWFEDRDAVDSERIDPGRGAVAVLELPIATEPAVPDPLVD